MNLTKAKRWQRHLFALLLLLVFALPAKLLWDVYRIPDYRGGHAYIDISPDGMYQGIDMFVPQATPYDGWSPFLMDWSDYNSRAIMGLADGKTGQILAYVPISNSDLSNGRGGSWECVDIQKGPCVEYQSSFRYSVLELPPNRWHRLVAVAATKLRGLGAPEFSEVEQSESGVFYPREHED